VIGGEFASSIDILHHIEAIHHEVRDDLLNLHRICHDLWKIHIKVGKDRNRVPTCFVVAQGEDLSSYFIYVDQLRFDSSFSISIGCG